MAERQEEKHPRGAGERFVNKANPRSDHARAIPGVLDHDEMIGVETQFGVDEEQVRRDHLISHALAALSEIEDSRLVFFGGTALSRTLLPDLRLSEDIDLISLAPRGEVATEAQRLLEERLSTTLGSPSFEPRISLTHDPAPSVMRVGDIRVQIQLLAGDGYPAWPTKVVDIEQRYSDAPPARMRTLTPSAFVAAKLASWVDRRASRDLYDLWALAEGGFIDDEAKTLFGKHGQFTDASGISFSRLPTDVEWAHALDH